jgi:formylglycine-generating enzyme required for sulfatase activity
VYRLLTETEREYATRAGANTPFWWGSSVSTSEANYNGNFVYLGGGSKGEYRYRTLPVDSFKANPWGLYQVHGNVWEWTVDCWIDSNSGNPGDGSARTTADCSRRVVRGGSFYNIPSWLRSARRHWFSSVIRNPVLGFRVARDLRP